MTRALTLVAVVSFVVALASFAGAFAIVGGPFSLDDGWRIERWDGHAIGWR